MTTKIQEIKGFDILPFFIVALLWGSTDVLIAKASIQNKKEFTPLDFSPLNLIKFVLKKRIWIWMGVNQIGSVLYAYLLGRYPEEYSLIWANCLTVFVSFLLQKLVEFYSLKRKGLSQDPIGQIKNRQCQQNKLQVNYLKKVNRKETQNLIGLILILGGIYLMLI